MTWQCITANESPSVDRPFEVVPRAAELLIANGWQPPPNQEPTGSFLLPKGGPMKLTRHQADLVLRHYTAEYAELSLKHYAFDTAENFGQLVRETSAAIQGTLTEAKVDAVLRWWRELSRRPFQHRAHAEGELNIAVNEALDNAGVSGKWILRRGEQQPVSA